MESFNPRVLVIGPGGNKGFMALGCLSPLEDANLFQYTDTFCGVSVGAIICLMIICGYNIREIVSEAAMFDIFKDIGPITINNIISNKGLLSNEPIRKYISQLVLNKLGSIPTLNDLYLMTGKSFLTVSLNTTDEIPELIGRHNYPDLLCVEAAMLSKNIPFVFYELIHNGKTYVDGALANPYPIDYFDDGNTDILGITMKTGKKLKVDNTVKELSFTSYIHKMISSLIDQRRNNIIQNASNRCKHITLESGVEDSVHLATGVEDKAHMLVAGYNIGKVFLANLRNQTYQNPEIPAKIKYTYPDYYMRQDVLPENNKEVLPLVETSPMEVVSSQNNAETIDILQQMNT